MNYLDIITFKIKFNAYLGFILDRILDKILSGKTYIFPCKADNNYISVQFR